MAVLYDIALVIGGETSVRPLLTKTVQRILYHTSYPTGLVFLDLPPDNGESMMHVHLDAAVGDFAFTRLIGHSLELPARLLRGGAELLEDAELLHSLPGGTRSYGVCLRLPIAGEGVVLLLAPHQPSTELPLTHIFQPVMANLAKAILLCRHNDAYAAGLVAERDQAQRSLAESEEKFRSITTAAQDAIVMIDDQGQLAYWNPAAERMFGYKAEEVLGRKAHPLIAPARFHEAFEKGFATFVASGEGSIVGKTLESMAQHRDGSEFPVELSISGLRLNDRWHAVGILRDITTRKQSEAALRQSEASLAESQRLAQLGNWELELATNRLQLSDGCLDIFEFDRERFDGSYESFLDAVHPDDRDRVQQAYGDSVEQHKAYEIDHRLLMPDGRIKYVQQRGQSVYDDQGRPLHSVGTIQDVTRMHEVEEELRQAQKMEAVGTLVGGIAHDFNNKLAAITGNLFLAQGTVSDNVEATERLQAVEQLSFEAASMVQQLLAFARKGKVQQAPLTLVSFIKEAAKLNRVAIPEDIHFSLDYGKDLLPIMGDITQLQQVFLNLLTNARDALEGASDPRIDVVLQHFDPDDAFRAAHPEAEGVEAYACMTVTDNGCGIDSGHMSQIFDPFFTTKDVGKGTGLGLAMVYGVVKGHQGIIDVESQPGKGTTFSIYLPLHPEALDTPLQSDEEEVPQGHGELILVADDDINVLTVFCDVLESLNYKVLVAHDGAEAVELYTQHMDEIDMAVFDIVMPRLKGPEVARRIRKIDPDAKIIYATGYDSHRANKEEISDTRVLEKPYKVAEVGRILRETLDG